MAQTIQVTQGKANYWMWRFDQVDGTPLDNFWGKTPDQCVLDLIAAKNPNAGIPNGVAEVEILVDPYFPATIPSVDVSLRGLAAHAGGRNRLFADHRVKWLRDIRTNR